RQRMGLLAPAGRPDHPGREQAVTVRTLDDLGDVADTRVFVRVDYNVPLDGGKVADDSRIQASLPTLRELLSAGASLVLASHLGRPKGKVDEGARMAPVAERLAELIGGAVGYEPTDVVVDDSVERRCAELRPGEIVMLENLRFDRGEEANDRGFAERLARLGEAYVDDAFGAVHRAHASVAALPALFLEQGRPAAERGVLIQLPEDAVAAPEPTLDAPRTTVPASRIPRELMGLDIGPRTVEEFAMTIAEAKTILWNGPMGVFELEPFSAGTRG